MQFQSYFNGCQDPTECLYSAQFTRELAALPHVQRVGAYVQMLLVPVGPNGKPILPGPLANNEVNTIGSVGGEYFGQDSVVVQQGREPNPSRSDEFAATAQAARLLHWHVGQVVTLADYSVADATYSGLGLPSTPPSFEVRATLVGIVALNDAVVHDEVDQYPTFMIFTPALADRAIATGGAAFTGYSLRLSGGARDVTTVQHELIDVFPPGTLYNFHVTTVVEGQVERATKPDAIALSVFGGIAALATLLLAGQAIGRSIRSRRRELQAMHSFGATPSMLYADAAAGPLAAVTTGSVLAVIVSVAMSPLFPVGVVRQVDPSPGLSADWTVIAIGVGTLVLSLGAVAIVMAASNVPTTRRRMSERQTSETSRAVNGARRIGLPPAAVVGVRFAVTRGRGSTAVPVGSAVMGTILAVAVVITTLTFASGLRTLVTHPAFYGWNWSYEIEEAGSGQVPQLATRLIQQDRDVAAWTGIDFGDVEADGQTIPILMSRPGAPVSPPILTGRGLRANDQIVLGPATMEQLHKRLGDTIVVSYGEPKDAPAYLPPTRLHIVGTATMPAIGNPMTLHPSMGTGALVSSKLVPYGISSASANPDPELAGPDVVLVRLRAGIAPDAGLASMQRIADAASNFVQHDPSAGSGTFEVLPVQQPAEIVNYRTMGGTPWLLALALALGALVALGFTLVASVNRRRRDLALLKSIGFLRGQLAAVVAWQASVAVVIGVIVGVPLGITLGRLLWSGFAKQIFAVPKPTVPVLSVALTAVVAVVLANLAALGPGWLASRTPTAELLRTE